MVKDSEEFEEEYGDKPDGLVGQGVKLESDKDKFLLEVPVADVNMRETEKLSTNDVNIISKMFKRLFDEVPDGVDKDDVRVYIEVDEDKFKEEWKIACNNPDSLGAFYHLREEEIDEERTRYVPKVVDVTEEENG
jgi:hypothetical protein